MIVGERINMFSIQNSEKVVEQFQPIALVVREPEMKMLGVEKIARAAQISFSNLLRVVIRK